MHHDSSEVRRFWQLNENLTFLNHGSFGATPRVVIQKLREIQDELEADPIAYLAPERSLEPKLDAVRSCLADLVGTTSERLAFVRNATDGVNAVLRSFPWRAGDEIVVTNHGYNACTNAAKFASERFGAKVVESRIPFPISHPQEVVAAIEAAITPQTRLILIDHVTSPTGLVFPVEQIVQLAHSQDIRVLVDGAHAPGMLPVKLDELGADYYTANHHKWLCGPKVSGFLYVAFQWQNEVRPTVISHAANRPRPNRTRFIAEFDWTGTFDPGPLLALPTALEFLGNLLPGGTAELMRRNHQRTVQGRELLLSTLNIDSPAPAEMLGSLAAIPLSNARFQSFNLATLQRTLYEQFQIEVPVYPSLAPNPNGDFILRISMQAYNTLADVQRLATALRQLLLG